MIYCAKLHDGIPDPEVHLAAKGPSKTEFNGNAAKGLQWPQGSNHSRRRLHLSFRVWCFGLSAEDLDVEHGNPEK